jgi:hypothetical protein
VTRAKLSVEIPGIEGAVWMGAKRIFIVGVIGTLAATALMAPAAGASWSYQNEYDATASWWAGRAANKTTAHRMKHAVASRRHEFVRTAKKIVHHRKKYRDYLKFVRGLIHKGKKLRERIGGVGYTDGFRGWIGRHFPRHVITDFGRDAALSCGIYGMVGYGIGKVILEDNSNDSFRDGIAACMWGIVDTFRRR